MHQRRIGPVQLRSGNRDGRRDCIVGCITRGDRVKRLIEEHVHRRG